MADKINYEEYLEVLDSTYKYILNFKNQLNKTIKRLRKIRDNGDDIVKSLNEFIIKSEINMEKNLIFNKKYRQYSQCISIVEDNRDAQIERLDTRLSKSFASLIECLKITRSKYKPLIQIYEKECSRNRKTNQSNTSDDLIFLRNEMKHLIENFEFEKSETFDLIFKEMTLINMSFCTQASKVYTNAFKCLSSNKNTAEINLAEMTKSLYQHNFESALMSLTNKMDKPTHDIPKFPYPIQNKIALNSTRTQSPKSTPTSSINAYNKNSIASNNHVSSNSLFAMIKLNDDQEEDFINTEQDSSDSSSEDESYESKKEKARLEFLQSLNETEL